MSKVISIMDKIAQKKLNEKPSSIVYTNNVVDIMAWQLAKMGWSPLELVGVSKQPEVEKAIIQFSAFFSEDKK